jgi:3-hydroxyisobutyrate dehydrogenase
VPDRSERVGFIGLGDQGAPIARRIARAGFALGVWGRRPQSVQPFDSVAEFAAPPTRPVWADVVGVCVVDDEDVRQVVTGPEGLLAGMARGSCLVIHSTVSPATCEEMRDVASATGVDVLDAPVSGGGGAAEAGTLTVMVGGSKAVFDRVYPVFDSFAGLAVLLGEIGAGQRAKIVNNMLFTAILAVSADALSAGVDLGLDEAALLEVLVAGSASSFPLRASRYAGGPGLMLARAREAHLEKDVALARQLMVGRPGAEEPDVLRVASRGIEANRPAG